MIEKTLLKDLRELVRRSALEKSNVGEGIIFSGGLDTSILAHVLVSNGYNPKLVTVGLKGFPAPDLVYSGKVARYLGLEHQHHSYTFDRDKFLDTIGRCIEILQTFDFIELRNSAAILLALDQAKTKGLTSVYTGDGADEVFGGYTFLFKMDRKEQKRKIRKLSNKMKFSTERLCKEKGLRLHQPFMNGELIKFAQKLGIGKLINERDGQKVGKWILRLAYRKELPPEIIWRKKTPIEGGSGTDNFPTIVQSIIEDKEFEASREQILRKDGVKLINKEYLFCYRIYRDKFGPPKTRTGKGPTCNRCGSPMSTDSDFCRTCGTYFGDVNLD